MSCLDEAALLLAKSESLDDAIEVVDGNSKIAITLPLGPGLDKDVRGSARHGDVFRYLLLVHPSEQPLWVRVPCVSRRVSLPELAPRDHVRRADEKACEQLADAKRRRTQGPGALDVPEMTGPAEDSRGGI